MVRILSLLALSVVALCSTGCGHVAVSAATVDEALDLMGVKHHATCVTNQDFGDSYANYQCGSAMTCDAMHDYRGADYISCEHQDMGEMPWVRCVVVRDGEMAVLTEKKCQMRFWMPGMWGDPDDDYPDDE